MRNFLVATVAVSLIVLTSMNSVQPQRRLAPLNIVFILIDDLRWDELGITGHPFIATPHIDRIAAKPLAEMNAY